MRADTLRQRSLPWSTSARGALCRRRPRATRSRCLDDAADVEARLPRGERPRDGRSVTRRGSTDPTPRTPGAEAHGGTTGAIRLTSLRCKISSAAYSRRCARSGLWPLGGKPHPGRRLRHRLLAPPSHRLGSTAGPCRRIDLLRDRVCKAARLCRSGSRSPAVARSPCRSVARASTWSCSFSSSRPSSTPILRRVCADEMVRCSRTGGSHSRGMTSTCRILATRCPTRHGASRFRRLFPTCSVELNRSHWPRR